MKRLLSLLLVLFPSLVLADSVSDSLSFAPPPGDFSVVFLANIFGVVDGLLHGTGSQIMGTMFEVFNSAVLAIGGVVIMYTLIVSTLNTAHDGEVLGKDWSSIWIPMRSTLGLALLVPKASGYCMMQIFVMWLVIQGIGAADKVWDAALGYLNRGGAIVQAQQDPLANLIGPGISEVAKGAAKILSGTTCLVGLKQALEDRRTSILKQKDSGAGPCAGPEVRTNPLCKTAVPDFLGSVNIVSTQADAPPTAVSYTVPMPNLDPSNDYASLNGICGSITWNPIVTDQNKPVSAGVGIDLTPGEQETMEMSRAIAIQQMYLDLATVAQVITNNNPLLNPALNNVTDPVNPPQNFAPYAKEAFGLPMSSDGKVCMASDNSGSKQSISDCTSWGSENDQGSLFSGVEFQGAMLDYSSIMKPTLSLMEASKDLDSARAQRAFINQAQSEGWAMAGSYFFNLVLLSGANAANSNGVDSGTGLPQSKDIQLSTAFSRTGCEAIPAGNLCEWLGGDKDGVQALSAIVSMINGSTSYAPGLQLSNIIPESFASGNQQVITGPKSSSVYGFINNSLMVQTPGQPGNTAPKFRMDINLHVDTDSLKMPKMDFGCGSVKTFMFSFCLGGMLGNIFYNLIVVNVYNYFLTYVVSLIDVALLSFLMLPLQAIAGLFLTGMGSLQDPNVNPIVGLATMGINYINISNQMWIYLLGIAIMNLIIPWFGLFMLPIMAFVMPLLIVWLGTMTAIGMVTAYYIPVLPYMIFTFGALAWVMVVIEAMVAAPIVALGVTHPEGHQAFGKGEHAVMILANVFLRPAMMIIGYIAAIALSFVAIWLINAGFSRAIEFMGVGVPQSETLFGTVKTDLTSYRESNPSPLHYTNWASIYAFFFSVLIYVTMYLTVVQKSYTLITYLPDKVLRWIGGTPENSGEQAAQWADEAKGKVESAGKDTLKSSTQAQAKVASESLDAIKGKVGGDDGSASLKGSDSNSAPPSSTPTPPPVE